jgi:hypothetical protein
MAETSFQVAPNSTGNKIREHERTVGADDVREQAVFQTARQTYLALVENSVFANSKQHFSLFNGSGSGVVVRVQKLFITNMVETAVSGGARRLDVKKITTCSAGTDITPRKQDSNNDDLPVQVLVKTGATVTEGAIIFPLVFPDDEMLLTQNSMAQQIFSGTNWMPEGYELQEYALREGQGLTIKQITNSTAGTASWIVLFSVEVD